LRKRHLVCAAIVAAAFGSNAQASMLLNGSFESPAAPKPDAGIFFGGSTGISGWTVAADPWDSVHLVSQTVSHHAMLSLNASHGSQWLDLSGPEWGGFGRGVTQTFAGSAGQWYSLNFDLGKLIGAGNAYVQVSVNGGPPQVFGNTSNSGTPWSKIWSSHGLQFEGLASNTVSFVGVDGPGTTPPVNPLYDSPSWSIGLDKVSVTPVPEPHAAVLLLAGLGIIAFVVRRRRRTS
jgi:hypothetical protein